ncbi:unnamed protein product, partial [marine sediment metagenome]
LNVFVPVKGDQCWDAPLPCAPTPKIQKQAPANLGRGAAINQNKIEQIEGTKNSQIFFFIL